MFIASYRNTEAGIRQIRAVNTQPSEAESLQLQIAELNAKLDKLQRPPPVTRVYRSTFQKIEERACRVFKVTPIALRSGRRHKTLALARQFVIYWAMRRTLLSSTQIGKLLGGRDHTTCLWGRHAYRKKRATMGRNLPDAR